MNPTPSLDPKGEAGSKKTPLHLLPPYALAQTALAHAEGARKYGPWNWRSNQVCATTYIGAIMRHLTAWQDGEDLDPDSGLTHIAKIAACCNILMDAQHCGTLVDDRSKVPSKAIEKFIEEEQRRFIRECRDVDVLLGEKDSPIKVTQLGGPDSGWGSVASEEIKEIIPMPRGLPPLPPVPEGYSRWEYRGKGWLGKGLYAISSGKGDDWIVSCDSVNSSGRRKSHYIEAVR
jgi:hypothetical protein